MTTTLSNFAPVTAWSTARVSATPHAVRTLKPIEMRMNALYATPPRVVALAGCEKARRHWQSGGSSSHAVILAAAAAHRRDRVLRDERRLTFARRDRAARCAAPDTRS